MKKITLAIIGNIHPKQIKFSIDTSTKVIEKDFEDVFIYSEENMDIDRYNDFCIKELYNHIKTEFVMIIQYDGMAVRKEYWTDKYFDYDYIGASWPARFNWIKPGEEVGNGGFSLRSARLLHALQDPTIQRDKQDQRKDNEDSVICQGFNSYLQYEHDIKFAPKILADRFSHEWCNPTGQSLGFHGMWNTPLFFDESTVLELIEDVPATYWYSDRYQMFRDICNNKRYFEAKMHVAKKIIDYKANQSKI